MREIKYRAWDGESVRYDVTGFEHGIKNEMAGIFLDGDYYSLDEHSLSAAMNNRHAVAMQYTGLKDKNSKEIYEGDVLEQKTPWGGRYVFSVYFDEKYKGFAPFCHLSFINDESKNCIKVIGNIYENPELLDPKEAL